MRVLVVEDQALIALKLTDSLQCAGHQVIGPAFDSEHARSLMASEAIDIAFVDVDLEAPLAGIDLSKELVRSGIPVIFTTAQPERVRESGAAIGVVTKPYDADEVAEVFPSAKLLREGDGAAYTRSTAVEWLDGFCPMPTTDEQAPPIMLVEDHPSDIELSIAALEMSHIRNPIIVARDGQEALDQLMDASQSVPQRPAFVLLDLKMPRVNGFEVLRRVRSVPELRSLPVVVFTSSRDPSDIARSYEEGASAVITKPRDFEEFKSSLGAVGRFWTDRNLAQRAL